MNRAAALAALAIASLAACGPSTPAQAPEAAKEAATAEPAASASAAPAAEPAAAKPLPEAESSATETLARDLIKAGGRRIGWSASKKRFVVPVDLRTEGGGRGLDLRFYDDEGAQREILRVCQPGECEERLNELAKELMPKLVARLDKEGFEAISSHGWPSGRDEIEVAALEGKLHYEKGRLTLVREKKTTPLRALGGKAPKGDLSAVYPVPAAKVMGVLAGDFFVFKLP